jgi:eukaryotic-like serine/threonine-protein kinase
MDAARREQIQAIPDQVDTLGVDRCIQFLSEASAGDDQFRAEVEDQLNQFDSIVADAVTIPLMLENAHGSQRSSSEPEPFGPNWTSTIVGRQIGPYLVTARNGGDVISDVFCATLVEDSSQQFAIKLVKRKTNNDVVLKRFHATFQVQAALGKHPNIISILDAGVTEDGYLYFVMEHVDGLAIDKYCENQKLTISTRLRLFAQVVEAVHFAHRHIIIHGDLKPGNILVTVDGIPKLVDFGFGALIEPEAGSYDTETHARATLTGTTKLVLSPEYASPEQVRGEMVTTGTDVYALGLVLYQILTGRWPYRLKSQNTAEIFQAICEQVPEKPSTAVGRSPANQQLTSSAILAQLTPMPAPDGGSDPVALAAPEVWSTANEIAAVRGLTAPQLKRVLTGDLDAIVLMAMRKEPEWRYTSAEQLTEDLHRYFKGLPVLAHRDTPGYRINKFIKRHVTPILVGLMLLLALVSGIGGAMTYLVSVRRAHDRIERSVHKARQTVDQFFNRVDNERLLGQPELIALRKTLLQDTQRFYEDFLNNRGTDPSLRAEIAAAYARLAKIAHLTGSSDNAIARYQQAISLWKKLVTEQPHNQHYQANLAQTLSNSGVALMAAENELNKAIDTCQQSQKLVESLITAHPESVRLQVELATILLNIAEIQRRQDEPDQAVISLNRVLAIKSQSGPEEPGSVELRIALATAHANLGQIFGKQPDQLLQAASAYGRAIELHKQITREHPEFTDQSYRLASELSDLSNLQQKLGHLDPAFENTRRALQILERIAHVHPNIAVYQAGLGMTYNHMSELEGQRREKVEALTFAQKGRSQFEHLVAENPQDISYRRDLIKSYNNLGRLLAQAGEAAEALRTFQRSVDLVESLTYLDPQDSYQLACSTALCIPLIGVKKGPQNVPRELSKSDQLRRKLYGERAIQALRRSADGGFLNIETFQNDRDLDPLRTRADFQALAKEVEDKPPATGK